LKLFRYTYSLTNRAAVDACDLVFDDAKRDYSKVPEKVQQNLENIRSKIL